MFNPMIKSSEAEAYIKIEDFVDLVIATSDMPFHIEIRENEEVTIIPRFLSNEFSKLTRYWGHYRDCYSYEVKLQAFWDACKETGFISQHGPAEIAYEFNQKVHAHAYAVNDLVRFIRARANTKEYLRRVYDLKYQASEKCDSIERFVAEAFARYSRSLVVRVDLGYVTSYQDKVNIEQVFDQVDAFCRAKETDEAFRGLVGYALAIEQGRERGYHIHFAAIFDGNQFQKDWPKGVGFARLWLQIVGNGNGAHICSYDSVRHPVRGVGRFERDEPETHEGVVRTLCYLTAYKEAQYLRARPSGRRALRTYLRF